MRIVGVKIFIVHALRDNWVIARLYTDEGVTGVGEGTVEGREMAVSQAIGELARYLEGKNPFEIEKHWYTMFRDGYWGAGAILTGAISAVDGALWDIKGKVLGVPVYELLGGRFRQRIRLYANRWFFGASKPSDLAQKALEVVEKGYTAIKWDPFGKAEWSIGFEQLREAKQSIAAVRKAVGDEVDILIEGHGRFNTCSAIQVAEEIAEYRPMFFEEPVMPENIDALAEVRARSSIPIAAGERFYTKFDFRVAIEKRAVDIIQPDVRVTGGITETRKIAAMAEANFLSVAPHNIHGPVGTLMTIHLMSATPNALILEYSVEDVPWKKDIFKTDLEIRDGFIEVPDAPGLGIDFDEEAAENYPYRPISMIQDMFE